MSVSKGLYASKPGSASNGDIYLPTDSFYDFLVWGGGAWKHILNGLECTPPINSEFAWVNQGSATTTTTNGGVFLSTPAAAGTSLHLRVKLAPATPYTLTTMVIPAQVWANTHHGGICFRESSSGRLITLGIESDSIQTRAQLSVFTWASPTDSSGARQAFILTQILLSRSGLWLRIADDGTTYTFSFSADGQNFVTIYTLTHAAAITAGYWTSAPDQIGFGGNPNNATYDWGMTLLHWDKPNSVVARHYGFWGLGASQSSTHSRNIGIIGR